MNLPAPETLALVESRYNEWGYWMAENAPEIFQAAQQPFWMTVGVAGLVGTVGAGVSVRAAVPALYYKAARGLAEPEAAITWGYREQQFFDHHTKLPIPGL